MSEVRRVAIFGTESTGKSSLAAGLAAHFGEPWAAEYVREFWDARGGRIGGGDLEKIAGGSWPTKRRRRGRRGVFVFVIQSC